MTEKQETVETSSYIVKPVYKSLQVLLCLEEARQPLTLTEICYRVRLPKTTVFRYLYTLRACGFVEHSTDTDLYWLGLTSLKLGHAASNQLQVRAVALPYMEQLRDRFNETVNLGVLDGKEVVYIEMVESRHSLRLQARPGSRDWIHSTALGKTMLAFMPREQWSFHLPERLEPRTPQTLTSLARLERDLADARICGYALDDQENETGARCVGAPIFDSNGSVHTAISLSGPVSRLPMDLTHEIAGVLVETATAISEQLGYREE